MSDSYENLMLPWHEHMQPCHASVSNIEERPPIPGALRPIAEPETSTKTLVIEAHRKMQAELAQELLSYIHAQSATFFEQLIIDLTLALGYGGRRRDMSRKLGRSGDGGIDGVIELDELGLDVIYLQAKRLKPASTVPVSAVRDFVGSLEARHASKGIFVTTADFTPAAQAVVEAVSKKVVLINGKRMTELMIRSNIGVKITDSLQFKKLDREYFSPNHTTK